MTIHIQQATIISGGKMRVHYTLSDNDGLHDAGIIAVDRAAADADLEGAVREALYGRVRIQEAEHLPDGRTSAIEDPTDHAMVAPAMIDPMRNKIS